MYRDKTVLQQNRQRTYNNTSWHSRAVTIAMETQQYVPFLIVVMKLDYQQYNSVQYCSGNATMGPLCTDVELQNTS